MKKQWITTKELAKIKNISERAVRKSIATRKYVTRKCGKSYEILVTSLEENVIEKITEVEEKIVPFDTTYKNVPEEQKKLALAKFDLIKRWEEYKTGKKSKTKAGKDFLELYNRELLYKELHEKIGNVAIDKLYQSQHCQFYHAILYVVILDYITLENLFLLLFLIFYLPYILPIF